MSQLFRMRVLSWRWSCLTLLFVCASCDSKPSAAGDLNPFAVTFKEVCSEGRIAIRGTLSNKSTGDAIVKSGSFPWQYDALGSEFKVFTRNGELHQSSAIPMLGRTGPIKLKAGESMSGITPIGQMFPELATAIVTQPVTIRWRYRTSVTPPEIIDGSLTIRNDPCAAPRPM